MRAKDRERYGPALGPKGILKGFIKPKKISASMEADPREGFLKKAVAESIATTDGGTMWPAIKPSSRWTAGTATIYGTGSVTSTTGSYLGSAISSGWSGSFGSSLSYTPWPEECDLSAYHQEILMKAICDKIATDGVAPSGYITWTSGGLSSVKISGKFTASGKWDLSET